MKKYGHYIFILIIMVMCLLPFAFMPFFSKEASSENRRLSSFPSFSNEEGINLNYLSELGDYFTDHFAFREDLVSINARLTSLIFGVSAEDDIILGTDGWLYYESTLDDYQHNNSVSDRMLYAMAHNTRMMQEYTNLLGIDFIFTIAPNKNSLYGDNMPSVYNTQVSPESDAQRLLPYLEEEGVNYLDLFELFKSEDEVLYYKEDSHWTEKGAVMVYNKLLDMAGVEHETYASVDPVVVKDHVGDLASMLYAKNAGYEDRLSYISSPSYSYTNGETVEDTLINTYNPEGHGSLLMYRDSFGNSLLPYFANEYENAQFSKVVPYTMTDLITCEPGLLIVEKVERHIQTLGEVPPVMSALSREDIDYSKTSAEEASVSVTIKENGPYYEISGFISDCKLKDKANIYIKLENSNESKLYEAFIIGKKKSQGYSDQGYIAYIPAIEEFPSDTNISIISDAGRGYEILGCEAFIK